MIKLASRYPFSPQFARALLLGILATFLVWSFGCATLLNPGEPPVRLNFSPSFAKQEVGNAKTRKMQLIVTRPNVPVELSGDSIIMLLNQRELRRLAGYRWASSIPDMVQRSMVTGFEQSGAFASVTDERSGITARMRVLFDMDQFVLRYPAGLKTGNQPAVPPTAVIQGVLRLVDYSGGQTLATLPLTIEEPASGTDVNSLAAAMEKAVQHMMGQAIPWAAGTLGK